MQHIKHNLFNQKINMIRLNKLNLKFWMMFKILILLAEFHEMFQKQNLLIL